jgi:hypothetical protein
MKCSYFRTNDNWVMNFYALTAAVHDMKNSEHVPYIHCRLVLERIQGSLLELKLARNLELSWPQATQHWEYVKVMFLLRDEHLSTQSSVAALTAQMLRRRTLIQPNAVSQEIEYEKRKQESSQ